MSERVNEKAKEKGSREREVRKNNNNNRKRRRRRRRKKKKKKNNNNKRKAERQKTQKRSVRATGPRGTHVKRQGKRRSARKIRMRPCPPVFRKRLDQDARRRR